MSIPANPPPSSSQGPGTWPGVATYLLLTFALSWGGVVAVVGFGNFPGTPEEVLDRIPQAVAAMLLGPSLAGIGATAYFLGRPGLRDLGQRALKAGVAPRWYALALLVAPVAVLTVLTTLSYFSPVFRPGIASVDHPLAHFTIGVGTGIAAGLFEEIGWTGFLTPRLRARYGVTATGLIIGVVWGAWHLLVVWWGSGGSAGSVPMFLYLPLLVFAFLIPYRLLMVQVYEGTGSLLLAMVMHAALTASVRVLDPILSSAGPILLYNLALGGAFWGVLAARGLGRGRR